MQGRSWPSTNSAIKLRAAIAKKDRGAFCCCLRPTCSINFGGENGRAAFAKQWAFRSQGTDGNVWDQLNSWFGSAARATAQARIIPSMTMQLRVYDAEDLTDCRTDPARREIVQVEAGVESSRPATRRPGTVAKVTSRAADWGTGVRLPDGREGYIADERSLRTAGLSHGDREAQREVDDHGVRRRRLSARGIAALRAATYRRARFTQ